MEFVDKNGLTVKCSVAEYRELTDQPRLILKNSITVMSGSKPRSHHKKRGTPKNSGELAELLDKRHKSKGTYKRMKFIQKRIKVLRKNNLRLSYADAFQRANKKWNKKHKLEFGGEY
jgi:hypothetical protein